MPRRPPSSTPRIYTEPYTEPYNTEPYTEPCLIMSLWKAALIYAKKCAKLVDSEVIAPNPNPDSNPNPNRDRDPNWIPRPCYCQR